MKCEFCHNEFSNKQNLNSHQKRTKYCLVIQGQQGAQGLEMECNSCHKTFNSKYNYGRHVKTCKQLNENLLKDAQAGNLRMVREISLLKQKVEILTADKKDLQDRYDNLSVIAVKKPTTSTKNIQINNYIKNMAPLLVDEIKDMAPMLTLEHHVKGAEGYAEYALEFPFREKIVCVDVARDKIKYKNEHGDIIEDVGLKKVMTKLCGALKDRSFNLSQEHYDKLSQEFNGDEMDDFNFMETAMAITKYANGKESDFCREVIKRISKGSVV
jgi:hypothetical protein